MAHNRSVLKERRIPSGAITCFAVAECRCWRWESEPRRGSAGPVLRSQGTLGPAKLSRCRAMGIRVSTFLCSLRPDPAPLGVIGVAPRDRSFGRSHKITLLVLNTFRYRHHILLQGRALLPWSGCAIFFRLLIGSFLESQNKRTGI